MRLSLNTTELQKTQEKAVQLSERQYRVRVERIGFECHTLLHILPFMRCVISLSLFLIYKRELMVPTS